VIKDKVIPNVNKGRTNAPSVQEVAVVVSDDMVEKRDIVER